MYLEKEEVKEGGGNGRGERRGGGGRKGERGGGGGGGSSEVKLSSTGYSKGHSFTIHAIMVFATLTHFHP